MNDDNFYAAFLKATGDLLSSQEYYNKLETKFSQEKIALIVEDLKFCIESNCISTALESLPVYFFYNLAQVLLSFQPSVAQFLKVADTVFNGNKSYHLLGKIDNNNIYLLYDFLSTRNFKNDEALLMLEGIFETIKDKKNGYEYGEAGGEVIVMQYHKLKNSCQNLLKNHYEILKEDNVLVEKEIKGYYETHTIKDMTYSQMILSSIKEIFQKEDWHEFSSFLPTLLQRHKKSPLFTQNRVSIVELNVDNNAMLGAFNSLMNDKDVYSFLEEVVLAFSIAKLKDIEEVSLKKKNLYDNISLIVSCPEGRTPSIEKLETLLIETCSYYHNSQLTLCADELKIFIEHEWCNICIPQLSKSSKNKNKI